MTWFAFRQNNSSGRFDEPAVCVVVESSSEEEAKTIASANGVDEEAPYCPCCGERWSLSYAEEFEDKPSLEDLLGELWDSKILYKGRGVPRAMYVSGKNVEVVT